MEYCKETHYHHCYFALASSLLNKLNAGYEEHTTTRVSLLIYMDDLKLIGKTEEELQK